MITITFTASIVKKAKGCFVAHAEEFPLTAEPASTQRGAIKKLKIVVLGRLRQAAERGAVTSFLDDAGYVAELIGLDNKITLQANIHDSATVSVPLGIKLLTLDRANWHHRR
jgi:hypothetical protein